MSETDKALLTIDELALAAGLPIRTVRFYVAKGLVDRPEGETRSARYSTAHLEQIRNIKALQQQGMTLSRIAEIKKGSAPAEKKIEKPGEAVLRIEVKLAKGIFLVFNEKDSEIGRDEIPDAAQHLLDALNEFKQKQPAP